MISEYLVKRRNLKNGLIKPDEKKTAKPIAKRSEKLKEAFKGYKKQVKAFLSKPGNLRCKVRMACNGVVADAVHHLSGRIGAKLKDEYDWMPVCFKCHQWIEENDSLSRKMGFKKSRHEKAKSSEDSK